MRWTFRTVGFGGLATLAGYFGEALGQVQPLRTEPERQCDKSSDRQVLRAILTIKPLKVVCSVDDNTCSQYEGHL